VIAEIGLKKDLHEIGLLSLFLRPLRRPSLSPLSLFRLQGKERIKERKKKERKKSKEKKEEERRNFWFHRKSFF